MPWLGTGVGLLVPASAMPLLCVREALGAAAVPWPGTGVGLLLVMASATPLLCVREALGAAAVQWPGTGVGLLLVMASAMPRPSVEPTASACVCRISASCSSISSSRREAHRGGLQFSHQRLDLGRCCEGASSRHGRCCRRARLTSNLRLNLEPEWVPDGVLEMEWVSVAEVMAMLITSPWTLERWAPSTTA